MIDPGRLKTRLTVQAPVETDDGQGGVSRDYATQDVVWAAVVPLAAAEKVAADADGAALRVRIVLRRGTALTLRHRLVDGERVYRVVAFRDLDQGRFVEIDAELRLS